MGGELFQKRGGSLKLKNFFKGGFFDELRQKKKLNVLLQKFEMMETISECILSM